MVYLVISGASGDLVSRRRRPEKGERGGYVYRVRMRAVPFFIVVGVLVDVNALVRQAAGGHATPLPLHEAERARFWGQRGAWERSEKLIGPCELCRKTLTT